MEEWKKIICLFISALLITIAFVSCIEIQDEKTEEIDWPNKIGDHIITIEEAHRLIRNKFGNLTLVILFDRYYELVNKSRLKEALLADKTDKHLYIRDKWDCDDFAFTLWRNLTNHYDGVAIGVVILALSWGAHAANFFIDQKKEIHFLEPQNDMIDPPYRGFPMVFIM